jgi:G:T-mismatch repair DNA endonuclease (very short patch repair protein)
MPQTRKAFWLSKFEANRVRDARARAELLSLGWRVLTVWDDTPISFRNGERHRAELAEHWKHLRTTDVIEARSRRSSPHRPLKGMSQNKTARRNRSR